MKSFCVKKLLRTGLNLSHAVTAITLVTCYASAEIKIEFSPEELNRLNEASWRIIAQDMIATAPKDSFIKNDKKYGESIRKFIGKAIANCVTNMGEFANKKSSDVITLAPTPNTVLYTAENWNAVVLLNYLHVMKWHFIEKDEDEDVNEYIIDGQVVRFHSLITDWDPFEIVKKNIIEYYSTNYKIEGLENKIDKAIGDIKQYAKELYFYSWIKKFVYCQKNLENNKTINETTAEINVTPNLIALLHDPAIFHDESYPGILGSPSYYVTNYQGKITDFKTINIEKPGSIYPDQVRINLQSLKKEYKGCLLGYVIYYVRELQANGQVKTRQYRYLDPNGNIPPAIEDAMAKAFEGIAVRVYLHS